MLVASTLYPSRWCWYYANEAKAKQKLSEPALILALRDRPDPNQQDRIVETLVDLGIEDPRRWWRHGGRQVVIDVEIISSAIDGEEQGDYVMSSDRSIRANGRHILEHFWLGSASCSPLPPRNHDTGELRPQSSRLTNTTRTGTPYLPAMSNADRQQHAQGALTDSGLDQNLSNITHEIVDELQTQRIVDHEMSEGFRSSEPLDVDEATLQQRSNSPPSEYAADYDQHHGYEAVSGSAAARQDSSNPLAAIDGREVAVQAPEHDAASMASVHPTNETRHDDAVSTASLHTADRAPNAAAAAAHETSSGIMQADDAALEGMTNASELLCLRRLVVLPALQQALRVQSTNLSAGEGTSINVHLAQQTLADVLKPQPQKVHKHAGASAKRSNKEQARLNKFEVDLQRLHKKYDALAEQHVAMQERLGHPLFKPAQETQKSTQYQHSQTLVQSMAEDSTRQDTPVVAGSGELCDIPETEFLMAGAM